LIRRRGKIHFQSDLGREKSLQLPRKEKKRVNNLQLSGREYDFTCKRPAVEEN
jgi:hypothetical protein